MFMYSFSYVSPHVTVFSYELFTEIEQQTRDTSAHRGADQLLCIVKLLS